MWKEDICKSTHQANGHIISNNDLQPSQLVMQLLCPNPQFKVHQYFSLSLDDIESIFFWVDIVEEGVLVLQLIYFKRNKICKIFSLVVDSLASQVGIRVGDCIHIPNLPIGIWDPQCLVEVHTQEYKFIKTI